LLKPIDGFVAPGTGRLDEESDGFRHVRRVSRKGW
jgi:hypothetical protein